jgi:murein DD-endopeptidase MepM/ murein hydrolase activator NlpD
MASMMGEDYETAKQQYLASAAGSSTTSDDTTTGTTSGTIYDVVDASDASLADMKKPDAIQMADLKTIPHVSANQIKAALQKYFINKGGTFKAENLDNDSYGLYDAQENSGLSAIVPMGISALESGWGGTSKIAKEKGNLWGWGASNSNPSKNAKTFDPNDMGLSFKNYSIALLNKYYDEYGAHSINAIGTGNNKAGLGYAYTDDGKISTTWAPSVQSTSKRIVEAMPEGSETKVGSSTQTVKGPGSARIVYGTAALRRFKSRSIGYGGDWLNIVSRVKAAIGNQKLGYSQSKKITVTLDGVSRTNRRDCSGFVSLCVSFYTGSEFNGTSSTFNSSINSTLSNAGFAHLSWPGWDGLVAGDIIARNNGSNGHVEIYAGKENGRHKVYNCGGNDSCNTPGTTNAGSSPFTSVWRPNSAGTAITNVASTGDSATGTDADGTSTTSTTVLTPFAKLIATIKSAGESMMTVNGKQIAFGPGSNSGNNPAAWFTNTLGGSITSGYGARSTSLGNEYHKGLDISAQNGQDIYSPIDGEVVSTGTDVAGYGNYAVVRDSEGNNHIFAHMNKPVGYGVGSKISKNDVIGQVGSSGNATGDHLHYEIRRNGNKYSAINPMNYKYDNSVGKSLNVNTVHSSQRGTELEAVGSGKRDLSTEAKEKLDVAINTTNIEDKMDTMIEALKIMVDNSSKVTPATSNTVNNTTTTVAYGTGKSNTKTSTKKSSSKQYDDSMSLAEIHKAIATRS